MCVGAQKRPVLFRLAQSPPVSSPVIFRHRPSRRPKWPEATGAALSNASEPHVPCPRQKERLHVDFMGGVHSGQSGRPETKRLNSGASEGVSRPATAVFPVKHRQLPEVSNGCRYFVRGLDEDWVADTVVWGREVFTGSKKDGWDLQGQRFGCPAEGGLVCVCKENEKRKAVEGVLKTGARKADARAA